MPIIEKPAQTQVNGTKKSASKETFLYVIVVRRSGSIGSVSILRCFGGGFTSTLSSPASLTASTNEEVSPQLLQSMRSADTLMSLSGTSAPHFGQK